jgi:hypothetical protein
MHRSTLQNIIEGRRLSAQQAEALAERLASSPDDLELRLRALGAAAIADRTPHILWLIGHHPTLGLEIYWRIPNGQPAAVATAAALWREAVESSQVPLEVVRNAAWSIPEDRKSVV